MGIIIIGMTAEAVVTVVSAVVVAVTGIAGVAEAMETGIVEAAVAEDVK